MKILCLADLHINNLDRCLVEWLEEVKKGCDIVVIAGDIFESSFEFNPYKTLADIFKDQLVICVLGNHEFVFNTIKQTEKLYKDLYDPKKYNVHYLDIIGHYEYNEINFVGNVLWYDGSTATIKNQNILEFAHNKWLDRKIKRFNPKQENIRCIHQINQNLKEDKKNILVTHCVPHYKLNLHMEKDLMSEFNAFSGVYNLFEDLLIMPEYAICGHTHERVVGLEINGCKCINVGNNYLPPFQHFKLEI